MNISVIGLGKLGSPLAAVLATKGHTVTGVDLNEEAVRKINAGEAPVFEPGLSDRIREAGSALSATTAYDEAIATTDVTFVIVPTPSLDNGAFSMEYALKAAASIGRGLAAKDSYHLVVLTSTVMPGCTDAEFLPALEEYSGKRCPEDFGVCYSPEFIALGSVINDMLHPDVVLIGEADRRAGDLLESIYRSVVENEPTVARMNPVNAELTKLAINTFVTTKISYANMLAEVCERLPGANVDVVTQAVGGDSRIGRKFLKGATGYGGPCFPRDNVAFAHLAREVGAHATLAEATQEMNAVQDTRLAEMVLATLPAGGRVGILGLSYKPGTNVVEKSPSLALVGELLARDVPVVVYDPAAMETARRELGDRVTYATSAAGCVEAVDAIILMTAWEEFRSLSLEHLSRDHGRPTVVDCWRMFDRAALADTVTYIALGVGPAGDAVGAVAGGKVD